MEYQVIPVLGKTERCGFDAIGHGPARILFHEREVFGIDPGGFAFKDRIHFSIRAVEFEFRLESAALRFNPEAFQGSDVDAVQTCAVSIPWMSLTFESGARNPSV